MIWTTQRTVTWEPRTNERTNDTDSLSLSLPRMRFRRRTISPPSPSPSILPLSTDTSTITQNEREREENDINININKFANSAGNHRHLVFQQPPLDKIFFRHYLIDQLKQIISHIIEFLFNWRSKIWRELIREKFDIESFNKMFLCTFGARRQFSRWNERVVASAVMNIFYSIIGEEGKFVYLWIWVTNFLIKAFDQYF